jgi:hypothetical protein
VSAGFEQARRKLLAMVALNAVAILAAGGFAIGYFRFGVGWMLPAFILAVAAGFAVQIWFIYGLGRTNRGA